MRPASGGDDPVASAAAEHATRAALLDLRLPASPTPEDYEIAARLLGIIAELTPDDADLARLRTAAAFNAGDPDLLAEATARIVALDPSDTVAQLRLITARIASKQTAEDRLAVYDRLLGPRGVSIAPTVRSRLALDAALIERERGDLDGFLRLLTLATDLDRTNKEAQHLAVNYYAEYAGDDPDSLAGLLELQLNLMWADPIDPNVHFAISRQLAVEGAMREAMRFYSNGVAILSRAGLLEPRHKVEQLAMRWLLEGPRVVLDTIERELKLARDNARLKYERDLQRDVPDRLLVPPEEVFLDPLYEKMRIIAAMDAQDKQALLTGLHELDRYVQHKFKEVQEATKLDDPKKRAQAFRDFAATLVSIQFMRALANIEMDKVMATVPQLPKVIGQEEWDRIRKPLEAWIALRSGDLEKTHAYLDEIGTRSSIMRVCKAELLAKEGKDKEAAAEYEFILRNESFVPYGAWARSRAMELTGRTDPVTPAGKKMQRLIARVPESLDQFISDPAALMSLSLAPAQDSFGPGRRVHLKITVTNTSPWPLSIGPSRTISSRFLLGVAVDDDDRLVSPPQPVVADYDRRFRLGPAEQITLDVDAEAGINGLIFDAADRAAIRQRWQVWQSPAIDNNGAYVAGPFGLSASTTTFTRMTRPESRLDADTLASLVRDAATPEQFVTAIEASAAWLRRGDRPGAKAVVGALASRYADAIGTQRALMLAALPNATQAEAMKPFDDAVRRETGLDAVRRLTTPRVVAALVLMTRVPDADDPLFEAAEKSEDGSLATLAALLSQRLRGGRITYATAGPGIDALAGSSKASVLRGARRP